jgi:hypothetical protein
MHVGENLPSICPLAFREYSLCIPWIINGPIYWLKEEEVAMTMSKQERGGNELVSMNESGREDYFIHSLTYLLITCKSVFVRNLSIASIVILRSKYCHSPRSANPADWERIPANTLCRSSCGRFELRKGSTRRIWLNSCRSLAVSRRSLSHPWMSCVFVQEWEKKGPSTS